MKKRLLRLNALPLLLIAISPTTFAKKCDLKQLDQLYKLMAQRNQLMESVAAFKYVNNSSVYDAKQELKVLQNSSSLSKTYQLDPDKLMSFVQIQMDLSKQIEAYWIDYWKATPAQAPTSNEVENIDTLRKKIANIDSQLYPAIAKNLENFNRCDTQTLLSQYNKANSSLQGIPTNPDYNRIVVSSLVNLGK